MGASPDLWRAIRWPLLVLAVAGLAIAVAAVLDQTDAREWALTIGGPARPLSEGSRARAA